MANPLQQHFTDGVAAFQRADWPRAEKAFSNVIRINPGVAGAWLNLALVHLRQHNGPQGIASLKRLVALEPTPENAFMLATTQHQYGETEAALVTLQTALAKHPNHASLTFTQVSLLARTTPFADWPQLFDTLSSVKLSAYHTASALLYVALHAWLARLSNFPQKVNQLGSALAQFHARFVNPTTNGTFDDAMLQNNLRSDFGFLGLLSFLQAHAPPPAHDLALPRLYIVGDSHTISPHGQTVPFGGQPHQVEGILTLGIKAWHLAQPQNNGHKHAMAAWLSKLPTAAPVLFSVGEIDCHVAEGIWPLAQKGKTTWQQLCDATFPPACEWLAAHAGNRPVTLCGIPAPHAINVNKLQPEKQADYRAFIAHASQTLRQAAAAQGWSFLDLHALTQDTADHHLEATHLKPTALAAALEKHFIS